MIYFGKKWGHFGEKWGRFGKKWGCFGRGCFDLLSWWFSL